MTVDRARAQRFCRDLHAVWPRMDDDDARLGLAVSGGPDSVALLLLAHAALPGRVEAATVDHGLRAESVAEAAMVARLCADRAVPHRVLRVEVAPGNVQEQARLARYAALGGWVDERGLAALATAHQMDDQAETLMMRLNRGSGVAGLAGIRRHTGIPRHGAPLVRPLLGWRRSELAEVVEAAGVAAVADPSNEDPRFDRVRIRKALAEANWLDIGGLARSVALLAEADEALNVVIARELRECAERLDKAMRYYPMRTEPGGLPLVRIGVIQAIFGQMGSRLDRGAAAQLVERLTAGQPTNVAGIQAVARDSAGERVWDFAPEAPRRAS